MKHLYFYDESLDFLLGEYCEGFISYPLESEDNDFYYYVRITTHRVCKKTHNVEYINIFTGTYQPDRNSPKFFPTKDLWEKAKSEYFAKLLSDNEADKQKILQSMRVK
jgi:hypothetical protein